MCRKDSAPNICLLLGTYNGERFLSEQLQSIEDQSHKNWRVVLSDDGSSDGTLAIARLFQQKWGNHRLEIIQGPRIGFCNNFLYMACDSSIRADLYAFSDQDDVWMEDKLAKAVTYFLNAAPNQSTPRVYSARTKLVDEKLKPLGFSPLFIHPTSFRNALLQSIAGGNTMVFNHASKLLLEEAGIQQVVSHDWWLYQIVKGAGGIVYYDAEPSILYRQHASAVIGNNSSINAKVQRMYQVINGRFKNWNTVNYKALMNVNHLLTPDNQDILNIYGKLRGASLKDRIRLLEICGIYRQTWRGTLSLWIATILNRI